MNELDKNNFAKKLLYQSLNRGYKENEIFLGKFAKEFLCDMTLDEMYEFEKILKENDADLYEWLMHKAPIPKKLNSKMMSKLFNFKTHF